MTELTIENIKQVGLVGSGQMGSGIAQVTAQAKINVIIHDISAEALQKAVGGIQKSLNKLAEKGKLTEEPAAIMARISTSTNINDLKNCDIAIEAVSENEELKKNIFKNLDEILPSHAIIATNTSSLPITRLGSYTRRAEQFIGMHFMNPVPIIPLLEVIRGQKTSDKTYEFTQAFAMKIGRTTVCVHDYPGFVVNRLLIPMINEAFYTLMEGVASAADIDTAMKMGTNQPMGPLALADFIGLDTCLAIMNVLHQGLGDSKYRPCPLLKKYVDSGNLGKKTSCGVYKY